MPISFYIFDLYAVYILGRNISAKVYWSEKLELFYVRIFDGVVFCDIYA